MNEGRSSRSVIAKDILSGFKMKRMKIRGGKVVLVAGGKRKKAGAGFMKKGMQDDTSERRPILACTLSEIGLEAILFDPDLRRDLLKALLDMYTAMYGWIKTNEIKRVPKDTERLRKSLMRSLTVDKSRIANEAVVYMELGSNLPYFVHVNEMPTKPVFGKGPHVRHPPFVGDYKTGKGGPLNDPDAVHHFYEWIVTRARNQAPKIIWKGITRLFNKKKGIYGWSTISQSARYFRFKRSGAGAGWQL